MMHEMRPACAACKKLPTSGCPHRICSFRDYCRDVDDRREIARIMSLSDAEIAAEVMRDGDTPESVAAKCRAIFERACAIVDLRRSPELSKDSSLNEANIESLKEKYEKVLSREQHAQSVLAAIRKVRDGYADQAKFADIEAAVYFREFVRRLDEAVSPKAANPPWGGRPSPTLPNGERAT